MAAQSKLIKFLKRCCCCCCDGNSDDTEANRGPNKSKQVKKETRKNSKKLRQERRERRAVKKSRHSIDEQSVGFPTDDVDMKESANLDCNNNIKIRRHLQPSASFPNLKDTKKRLLPLWNPRSMPDMLRSSKTSFLTTPNVRPTALPDNQPSLHLTSASFPNMKQVKKCLSPLWKSRSMPDLLRSSKRVSLTTSNLTPAAFSDYQPSLHLSCRLHSVVSLNGIQDTVEPFTSSCLSSWEELEIPPSSLSESFYDCSVSASSTSFLGNWEIISMNDILDGISPSLSSSSSTSSSFSLLEEDSTQRLETYSPSRKITSVSSSVSLSTEVNCPHSVQGAYEDHAISDELPPPIVPKMRKFYYELWPQNPWLSSKYNGFPEEKKLKPHERDDYWTTDRDGDPLRKTENVHFTWCDAIGTVMVVRDHQDRQLSHDAPPPCSEEYIHQTQSKVNIQKKDMESINWSAEDKISKDDDSDASEEKKKLCLLSSAPICSAETSTRGANVAEVKSSRKALLQQASGEDVLSEQPLNNLDVILSSIPTFPVNLLRFNTNCRNHVSCYKYQQCSAARIYDIEPTTILKFHHSGHVFTECLSQFITDSASFDNNSCAISHTLLVVTFYLFGLQSGDLLDSHNLQSTSVKKWLWKTIYVGNALHRSLFKRCEYIPATEAFKAVRDCFHLNSLAWRGKQGDSGIVSRRLSKQPSNLFLDIVNPYNLVSSLAFHTTQLDPTEGEAILYTINRNFFLLVPTFDNHVVLMDIHPHLTLESGAVILFCPKNTHSIQDMLNEFYLKTIKPFYSYSLGLANIICCPTNDDTRLIPRSLEEWISGI
ncbi:hypothetical protein HOLleu_31313 [Holothuria leucospilota]|uniref:Uncharacterized protein n=1 Tax=Holothuria leucospilota TaxID=206669 RepID=A0A9Q0YQ98_HOLLE|nr:hypothetical protein HOLleu_31313 [Holothuria leucospilota]